MPLQEYDNMVADFYIRVIIKLLIENVMERGSIMDISAVGAASTEMHLAQTQEAVGVAVLRKAMDFQETQADVMIQSLQNAAPSFGHMLDVLA